MMQPTRKWPGLPIWFIGGLGFYFGLAPASAAVAGEGLPVVVENSVASVPVPAGAGAGTSLAECIHMALERQPAIAAQRASLGAAVGGQRALANIRLPAFIVRDLPIRRQQAGLGVEIAAASIDQAQHETVYAVTRTYFSVIYARDQERIARGVVDHFKATHDTAKRLVEGGSRDVTTGTLDRIAVYQRLAETKQIQAAKGVDRALAALKEAIGMGPEGSIDVPGDKLPEPSVQVDKQQIIGLALARRSEMSQAGNLAEVYCLEVAAQGKSWRARVQTFASASDIHYRSIPQGTTDPEYRPGAIGPEMPTMLVGSKADRTERARAFSARAAAVADKTRNLVALEAEDAFIKWEEATLKIPSTREAATRAAKLADDMRKDFGAEQKVKAEDLVTVEVLSAQAQAQHIETIYQQILALAALERVTAGGFHAALAGSVSRPQE